MGRSLDDATLACSALLAASAATETSYLKSLRWTTMLPSQQE